MRKPFKKEKSGESIAVTESKALRNGAAVAAVAAAILLVVAFFTGITAAHRHSEEEKITAADIFAEALSNTMAEKGSSRVMSQFWSGYSVLKNGEASVFDGLAFDLTDSFEEYGPADEQYVILSDQEDQVQPETGETQRYIITGAEDDQGDLYDVQIEYNPEPYNEDTTISSSASHAYNQNEFPDLNSMNRKETVVIEPEASYVSFETDENGEYIYDEESGRYQTSKDSTMEESALDAFYNDYISFYVKSCETINSYLDELQVDDSHRISAKEFTATTSESDKKASIRQKTGRRTAVQVTSSTNVEASVIYTLTDSSEIGNPTAVLDTLRTDLFGAYLPSMDEQGNLVQIPITPEGITSIVDALRPQIMNLWNSASSASALQKQYRVYESDNNVSSLENIYLMYTPLRRGFWQSDVLNLDLSQAPVSYNTGHRLQLYLVPQIGEESSRSRPYNSIQASDYLSLELKGGTIRYDEADFMSGHTVTLTSENALYDLNRVSVHYLKGYTALPAAADSDASIVSRLDSQDIIYQLTIRVYRHADTSFRKSDFLTERTISCS